MHHEQIEGFWGELSACEHFVQIYDAEDQFMDTLARFIGDGLVERQSVIIIATPEHREELDRRLMERGIDVVAARNQDHFISLDAKETLAKFVIDGWPVESRFEAVVTDILTRATRNGRKVRAFGEMVALMWAEGHCAGTVRLEHLWEGLCKKKSFSLFCAYPKSGFTQNSSDSISQICATHSKVLAA